MQRVFSAKAEVDLEEMADYIARDKPLGPYRSSSLKFTRRVCLDSVNMRVLRPGIKPSEKLLRKLSDDLLVDFLHLLNNLWPQPFLTDFH